MVALLVFILFVAAQFGASFLALSFSNGPAAPVTIGRSMLACQILLCSVLWLLRKRKSYPKLTEAKKGTTLRPVFFATTGTLCLAVGLSLFLSPLNLSDPAGQLFAEMIGDPLCLLLLCIVGPLAEEMVFRAGIIPSLRANGLPGAAAAILSASVFALVHGNLAQAVPAVIIGTLFGLFFLRSGNLRLCLPAHIANNSLAVLLLALGDPVPGLSLLPAVVIGLALTIAAAFLLIPVFSSSHSS